MWQLIVKKIFLDFSASHNIEIPKIKFCVVVCYRCQTVITFFRAQFLDNLFHTRFNRFQDFNGVLFGPSFLRCDRFQVYGMFGNFLNVLTDKHWKFHCTSARIYYSNQSSMTIFLHLCHPICKLTFVLDLDAFTFFTVLDATYLIVNSLKFNL